MNIHFRINKKLLILFIAIIAFFAFFGIKWLLIVKTGNSQKPTPIITPYLTPLPSIVVKNNLRQFPQIVKTYQLKPAPFDIFGPGSLVTIADALAFDKDAQTFTNGTISTYYENGKTLTINSINGTISFSQPPTSKIKGPIDEIQARQTILDFFNKTGLSTPFWGWETAKTTPYNDKNLPTALNNDISYLRFEPTLKMGNYELLPPQQIFANVGQNGVLLVLSFWYPNIDGKNSKDLAVLSQKELQQSLNSQEEIIKGNITNLPRSINDLQLAYDTPLNLDFSKPIFLEPVFIYQDSQISIKIKATK